MNGTTSFEANQEEPGCAATGCPEVDHVGWERATRGIVRVMATVDRRSWSLLGGRFSARATKNRKRPVEAAGAVDAKNAPTAPWKTGSPVFHSYHRLFLLSLVTGKSVTHVPG